MTVLVDTHALLWWTAEPDRLSEAAADALAADALAVCGITWFELAWLARKGRIVVSRPVDSLLAELSADIRTIPVTWAIARTAAGLPDPFPGDPADRLIYATALEHGWRLVTKDRRLHAHPAARPVALW